MIKSFARLAVVMTTIILAVNSSFAQIVTNTNANGAGSLLEAINNAGAGGTITFNIPGAGPFIINTGSIGFPNSNNALTIDATSQPGWAAGAPVVIIRGGGAGSGNGFYLERSNLTIKGLIIQNFQNGYYQKGGSNNTIEGCWFGVDATGTSITGVGISQYGIVVESGGVVSIGSKTDFTAATRNIVSGTGAGGIYFNAAGSGCYLGNTFLGTDKTGTISLGNGIGSIDSELRHGVTVNATPSLTIKNNVISASRSGGIDVFGASGNSVISGNKIGTDATGTQPMGNRTFGIRIKNSNGHTIGGTAVADRNIISANGSSDYPHKQNTTVHSEFDWYNACGIYLFNTRNTVVRGNYIGVDATGNKHTVTTSYDMGNFYVGLKIEGSSSSAGNTVAGNVIGGNGFRSSTAAAAGGYVNLDGHGMIIKDKNTTNNKVIGNHVGVGANGIARIGNKQDGISIQGAVGTIVGGPTKAERNVIGDNVWGIFIATNYWDSQSQDNKIYGNYIGTDSSGTTEIGNGTRAGLTWGGGIGVIHFTTGTLVGGASVGQGNLISGNRIGIALMGNSPSDGPIGTDAGKGSTGAKVYGNLIGLAANGVTVLKNTTYGIYISQKANLNEIGGAAIGQGNKIVGNDSAGIASSNGVNNSIKGNAISKNGQNGISLFSSSTGNIIGGMATGEGNIIDANTGDGISIVGATSNNNSIHRNQISCNTGRGINLNGSGNNNYAKPTFSGNPTALVITGPTGSFIELYSLDGCNTCGGSTTNKLQGRTLIASGTSPLNYAGAAGTLYTATASVANASTGHNTSEFSDCYSLCTPPTTSVPVRGDTVCQGSAGTVRLTGGQAILYQAYIGTKAVSASVTGPNAVLSIPSTELSVGNNTIIVKATPAGVGCTPVNLDNTANIRVNTPPTTNSNLLTNGPICFGAAGVLTVVTPEVGKTYQVIEGNTAVSNIITSNVTSNLQISLNSLAVGTHTLKVKVGVQGCAADTLDKSIDFTVNNGLNGALQLQYTPAICLGSPASITILNSQLGVVYQAFNSKDSSQLSTTYTGTGGNLVVALNPLPADTIVVFFKGTIGGCGTIVLGNKATIIVDTDVKKDLVVTATSPICLGNISVVSIQNSERRKTYTVYEKGAPVASGKLGNGATLTIDVANLAVGSHQFSIFVTVPGCKADTLTQRPVVIVNSVPDSTLKVGTNGPVCGGDQAIFYIVKSQLGKKYQIFHGTDPVSQIAVGNGDTLKIPLNNLLPNTYELTAVASADGCATRVELKDKATITINSIPKTNVDAIVNGPLCAGNPAVVTIIKSEVGKTYKVYYKGNVIGTSPASDGRDSLKIAVVTTSLPVGSHALAIGVSVPGCVPDTLTKKPVLTINNTLDLVNPVVSAVTSPICVNMDGAVRITGIQPNVIYQAFIGSTNAVSAELSGPGPDLLLPITASKLSIGWNTISIKASIPGCGIQTLADTAGIKVNPNPNLDLAISVDPDVICAGSLSALTIETSQTGVSYHAVLEDNTVVSSAVIGNGGQVELTLRNLPEGINKVSVVASIGGCTDAKLDSSVIVTVNKGATTNFEVTGDVVCKGESATVTVSGSQIGIAYDVVIKSTGISISDTIIGTGFPIEIHVTPRPNGTDTVVVRASVGGCGPIYLDKTAYVTTNDNSTSKNLPTRGSTACMNDQSATAKVLQAKKDVTYEAYKGNEFLASAVGQDNDLTITIPMTKLASGENIIRFVATVQGCGPVEMDSTAIVYILGDRSTINGSDLVCYHSEGTYSITPIPGIVVYDWSVTEDATIISGDSTNKITVAFGEKTTTITMTPVGTIGNCTSITSELVVEVAPPLSGEFNILGNDTVCVNDDKIISIDSAKVGGVDRVEWTWSSGIDMLDTINKTGRFPLYHVKYFETGLQMIIARPHVRCADTLGKADTLLVRVLGRPVAEAGFYPPITDFQNLIPLNGTGSSVNGTPPADSLSYSWTALDKRLEIYNPNTLNGASFKPTDIETWVYLTVTNRNVSSCTAIDSALISGKPTIDIPNVFSPNNDGTHDTWEIKNLHSLFPNVTVEVFNKWGSQVYRSNGYAKPWDGTRNGEELPVATYYYVVDLKDGGKPKVASVTIIR